MEDCESMSSFFEPPPPLPEPPREPPRPRWAGAPDAEIGRAVALNLMLGRADKAAVWISAATVYTDGFEFDLEIRHEQPRLRPSRTQSPSSGTGIPRSRTSRTNNTAQRPLDTAQIVLRHRTVVNGHQGARDQARQRRRTPAVAAGVRGIVVCCSRAKELRRQASRARRLAPLGSKRARSRTWRRRATRRRCDAASRD